jgi:hypothetical protein
VTFITEIEKSPLKFKNTTTNKCWQGCRKNKPSYFCWESKVMQPLWKTIWRLLKKLKIDLQYHSWGYIYSQEDMSEVTTKAPAYPCLLQQYSQ